jgi:hypothetical protein
MTGIRISLAALIVFVFISCHENSRNEKVTTESLMDEMTDLSRLTRFPSQKYRSVQFSSYDRRSRTVNDSCWFSNEDGFGSEPIPGFEEVLVRPDSAGTGKYLICDVKGPGAVVRLWSANINGSIRLFLDNTDTPVYDGPAEDFFWKPLLMLSGSDPGFDYSGTIRQFDATYFPVPFSGRCRIEWTGDIRKIHFYHVGIRLYDPDVEVETYRISESDHYLEKLREVCAILEKPGNTIKASDIKTDTQIIPDGEKKIIFTSSGSKAITEFSVRLKSPDPEQALRKNVLTIWFDNSSVPQVEAPIGDFFGAAPGLNPYKSLPFTILNDSTMICRFVMPFRDNVKMEMANMSGSDITIQSAVSVGDYSWTEGASMHFRTRWNIDNGITASYFYPGSYNVPDILYLMATGKGRIAGAAAYICNPSNATTSWGNWWGEGDEKIFVDNDTFPSFFGTGSEDYFNYSWSSARIFSYPYCGQPRNDGPGNRGYVSNYRWHIIDDILFSNNVAFYMELGHHGTVDNFTYARIIYYYAIPGTLDNYSRITGSDISGVFYSDWKPIAYLGSSGYKYFQAEELLSNSATVKTEENNIASGKRILAWYPRNVSDRLEFRIKSEKNIAGTNFGLTLRHDPYGGIISVYLNGKPVKIDGKPDVSLFESTREILSNHFSEKVNLNKGINTIVIEAKDTGKSGKVGIDFIWMK